MLALVSCVGLAQAQQVTRALGIPSATTSLDGRQLPPPDPKSGSEVKQKASDSKIWWASRVVLPKGAARTIDKLTFKLAQDPVRAERHEPKRKTVALARD